MTQQSSPRSRFQTFTVATKRVMASRWFFFGIVVLLAFQATWLALAARYPQAFDENFHFGLIQLHAQQALPFFTAQPPGDAVYGAVTRDPSYLYHYLLGLLYEPLTHLTSDTTTQVIALRFTSIALFVGGLFVFRKVLLELRVPPALSHVVLLFFVLLPITPLLAGQINYDNLLFLLSGLLFLLMIRFIRGLHEHHTISVDLLLQILFWGSLTTIVKYAYAPIFLGLFVALAVMIGLFWRSHRQDFRAKFVMMSRRVVIVFSLLLILSGGLFIERYGVNLVQYHTPVPKCDKVLSVEACQAYSPWARDYLFHQIYERPTLQGIAVYPGVWFHRIIWETLFTVSSVFNDDGTVRYHAAKPLPIANAVGWTVTLAGLLLMIAYARRLWRDGYLRTLLLVCGFYIVVLFLQNFAMYLHSGEAVAIHGRYLIPIFPILLLALAQSFNWFGDRFKRALEIKTAFFLVTLILFLQGAGIVTWIARSEDWWYVPNNALARDINHAAKDVLEKTVIY